MIELIKAAEMLPVIEISLVISMAPFDFSIMPRRSRWYQLMFHTCLAKYCIKWTFLFIAYVFVGKFCSVVCLYRLYLKWKRFLQHFEKFDSILGSVLLKAVYEADTSTFIYRRPLVQMLAVPL